MVEDLGEQVTISETCPFGDLHVDIAVLYRKTKGKSLLNLSQNNTSFEVLLQLIVIKGQ